MIIIIIIIIVMPVSLNVSSRGLQPYASVDFFPRSGFAIPKLFKS
jgi:hypothetical protein